MQALPSPIVTQGRLSSESSYAKGVNGEALARGLLDAAGYEVQIHALHTKCGDLGAIDRETGEAWNVEVKTSKRDKAGRWNFVLSKHDRHGVTDCKHADVVLLLPLLKNGTAVPYLIPSAALAGATFLTISTHPDDYAGRWAKYRQRGPLDIPAAFETATLAGVTMPGDEPC